MQTQDPGQDAAPGHGWHGWVPPPPPPVELGNRPQVFWLLVLGTVLVQQLQLPFRLAGLVLCLPALWLGGTILTRLGRARRQGLRPARRAWPFGLGVGLSVVLLLSLGADAALYPIMADRERCLAGANTRAASDQCTEAVQERLRRLRSEFVTPR